VFLLAVATVRLAYDAGRTDTSEAGQLSVVVFFPLVISDNSGLED
jgi:hypothetical protein